MATVNRRVKRVDATKPRFFDEQGWPVYAVAAILAACGFAIIRAYADFLTPNFFKNAFLYCFLLTGASIGGFMLLRYYSQRTFRRLQLCFLLSILFHLVLSLFLLSCFFDVATVRDKVVDREIPPPDKMLEMVDIPDILLKQEIEEVKKPIDKPEEITETPQPQEPEVIKEKAEPEPEPVKEKELLVEKPPEETMQQPNPVEQERREITPPKFAEVMAREKPTRQTKVWETVPEKARPEVVQKTQPKKSEQAVAQMDTQARESAQDPLVKQRQLDVELPQAKERTELAKVEPQRRKTENAQPVERNVVKSPSTQRAKPLELVQADAPIPVEKPTTPREDPSELTPKQREQLASRTTEVKDPAKQVAQSDTPPAPTEVAQVNLTQRARNEDLSPSRTHQPAQQRNVKPVEKIADIKPQLEEEQPQEKPQPRELLAQVQPSSRSVPHPATAPPPVPVKQTELAPAPETAETQQPTVAKTTPRRRQSPQEPTQLAETQPRKAPEKVEPQKKPSEQLAEVKPEKTTPTAQSKPVAQVAVKNVTEASTKPPTTQPKPAAQTQQALASAPAATNPQTTTKAPTAREPSPTSTPAKVAETTPRQKPNQRVTEQELASLTSEVQAERAEPQASKSLAAETPTLVAKNQAPSAKTSNLPTPTVQQVATQAPQVPQPSATSQPQTTPAARRTPTEQKNEIATRSPSPASPQTPSRQEKAVELPSTSLLAKSEAEAPSRGAAASHSSQMDLANNAVIKTAGATPQESKTPTSSSNSPNATASASAPAKSGTLRAATQQVATATPTRTKPLPAREPTAANASGQLAAKEITTPVTPVPNSASGTVTPQVTTTARAGAAATTGAQVTQSSPAEQAAGLGSLPVEGEASLAATTPTQTLRQPSPSEITPSTRAAGGMRQPTPTTGTNAALAAADAQPEVESSPRPETLTTPLSPNQIAKLAATDAPDAKTAVPESAEAQQTPTSEAPSPQATQETAQQVVASTPVRRELTTATIETAATARAEQDQPSTQPRHLATTPINQMNVSNPAPEQQDNVAVGKTSAAEIMPQLATSFAKKTSTAPANTMPQPMEAATGENIPTLTGMQSNATTPSPSTPRKSELALVQPTSSPSRAQPKRTEVSSPRASSTGAIAAETEPTAKGQRVASATPKVEAQMSAAAGKAATPSLVEKVSDATMPVPELLTADATSAAVPTQAPSFEPQQQSALAEASTRSSTPQRQSRLANVAATSDIVMEVPNPQPASTGKVATTLPTLHLATGATLAKSGVVSSPTLTPSPAASVPTPATSSQSETSIAAASPGTKRQNNQSSTAAPREMAQATPPTRSQRAEKPMEIAAAEATPAETKTLAAPTEALPATTPAAVAAMLAKGATPKQGGNLPQQQEAKATTGAGPMTPENTASPNAFSEVAKRQPTGVSQPSSTPGGGLQQPKTANAPTPAQIVADTPVAVEGTLATQGDAAAMPELQLETVSTSAKKAGRGPEGSRVEDAAAGTPNALASTTDAVELVAPSRNEFATSTLTKSTDLRTPESSTLRTNDNPAEIATTNVSAPAEEVRGSAGVTSNHRDASSSLVQLASAASRQSTTFDAVASAEQTVATSAAPQATGDAAEVLLASESRTETGELAASTRATASVNAPSRTPTVSPSGIAVEQIAAESSGRAVSNPEPSPAKLAATQRSEGAARSASDVVGATQLAADNSSPSTEVSDATTAAFTGSRAETDTPAAANEMASSTVRTAPQATGPATTEVATLTSDAPATAEAVSAPNATAAATASPSQLAAAAAQTGTASDAAADVNATPTDQVAAATASPATAEMQSDVATGSARSRTTQLADSGTATDVRQAPQFSRRTGKTESTALLADAAATEVAPSEVPTQPDGAATGSSAQTQLAPLLASDAVRNSSGSIATNPMSEANNPAASPQYVPNEGGIGGMQAGQASRRDAVISQTRTLTAAREREASAGVVGLAGSAMASPATSGTAGGIPSEVKAPQSGVPVVAISQAHEGRGGDSRNPADATMEQVAVANSTPGEPSAAVGEQGDTISRRTSESGTVGITTESRNAPVSNAAQVAIDIPRGAIDTLSVPQDKGPVPMPAGATEVLVAQGADTPTRVSGGVPVNISAEEGRGGVGFEASDEVGLPTRNARRTSTIVHTRDHVDMLPQRTGGLYEMREGKIAKPVEEFAKVTEGRQGAPDGTTGPGLNNEQAVEDGLNFFALHQFQDGHWSLDELPLMPEGVEYKDPALAGWKANPKTDEERSNQGSGIRSDTAATGLVLLSYLGAGYTHLEHKYRQRVQRGVNWLIENQLENGDLFSKKGGTPQAHFYSHGIATIALCEAYGMTGDERIKLAAQKAIDFIVRTQQPINTRAKRGGGWRYQVASGSRARSTESDTSVTGWQLMALKSARMAGLRVPESTFRNILQYLSFAASADKPGAYIYNVDGNASDEEQVEWLQPSRVMTAEAMLMKMLMGMSRERKDMQQGAEYLKEVLPELGTTAKTQRNCYYWYYGTVAMFQVGGDYWKTWNAAFRKVAMDTQIKADGITKGSWHPLDMRYKNGVGKDTWGEAGGRIYVTAMHLLALEMSRNRYLPLYELLEEGTDAAEEQPE